MKLYASDLHFLGDTPQAQSFDCCVHGRVVWEIDGVRLSDDDSEWCVSASAYRFLHTLFENHFSGAEEQMIPCCGHFLIPSEDGTSVTIGGCPNGIDFDVIHENGSVIVRTPENIGYTVPFEEYKAGVLAYVKQVEAFYRQNPPRQFADAFDRDGFSAFTHEWYALTEKAFALADGFPTPSEVAFDDYDCCTEQEIAGVSVNGISLKNMKFINFRECAYRFLRLYGGNGSCIAESDRSGSNVSIGFYTAPKTTHIFFVSKRRLDALKKKIESFGFTIQETE